MYCKSLCQHVDYSHVISEQIQHPAERIGLIADVYI